MKTNVKIALLCSGLGHVRRGHEVFARDLFALLRDSVDITLFKGGGDNVDREVVVPNIPRDSTCLDAIHVAASPRWTSSVREQERLRVECETFAYSALRPLLDGDFDVIHCLEQEVCDIIHDNRHLFRRTPKILFSNGGAIPARDLPRCDFVQEHSDHNLRRSARRKAFMIPHGIDLRLFNPDVHTDFRRQHAIPTDAFLVISVGAICYWHKRMDYVIEEIAKVEHAYLAIVGQETGDTPAIKELGRRLMGDRVVFLTLPHAELPAAYAAANVFALGSLFETFGIAYIEAMAMGLPVICTNHVNQRGIVRSGIFIDMGKPGALTAALLNHDRSEFARIGREGREVAVKQYDLEALREKYVERYLAIAASPTSLPAYTLGTKLAANLGNALKPIGRLLRRR